LSSQRSPTLGRTRSTSALGALGGDVTRRPAREVYAEVREADEAEKAKLP
jgi:hypothetical protein